jgi:hypothetical protein
MRFGAVPVARCYAHTPNRSPTCGDQYASASKRGRVVEVLLSANSKSKWGKWILINAVISAWLTYDIATATEAPRQALMILQYVLLACALFGLAGSLIKYVSEA